MPYSRYVDPDRARERYLSAGSVPTPGPVHRGWIARAWAAMPEGAKPDRAWLASVAVTVVVAVGIIAACFAWIVIGR